MKNAVLFIVLLVIISSRLRSPIRYWGSWGYEYFLYNTPPIAQTETIGGFQYSYSKQREGYYGGIFTEFELRGRINLLIAADYSEKKYYVYATSLQSGFGFISDKWNKLKFGELRGIFIYGLPLGHGKIKIGAGGNAGYVMQREGQGKIFKFLYRIPPGIRI